jgi:predicted phosphodiesterase
MDNKFDPNKWAEDEKPKPTKTELSKLAEAKAREIRKEFAGGDSRLHEADLIKDILRCADAPDNRYPGTCSRARYCKFGYYPEEVVVDLFGNHAEFQRSAGLLDNRTTTAYRNRRAKLKTEERISDYIHREIMPWVGCFERKPCREHISLLVGSDFHGKEVDPFALEVFLDVADRTKPDVICLNGDILDFYEPSRWSSNPSRLLDLQGEIDWVVDNVFRPLRELCPESQIDFFVGNHEYRLVRYLADTAPALASLDCLSFPELLKLKEFRINLVHNASSLDVNAKDYIEDWKVYGGCFTVTHGRFSGQYPAAKELAVQGGSGTSGHVHTPQYFCNPTDREPYADWLITPMMANREHHGKEFVQGPSRWITGFAYIDIFPSRGVSLPQLILQKAHIMAFGGHIYKRTCDSSKTSNK